MKVSLPLRIFAVHLLFVVGLGALAAYLVQRQFDRYRADWEREVATLPTERLFDPLAAEVARSLLLRVREGQPETRAMRLERVTRGLDAVVPALPSIRRLAIVDQDLSLLYVNDAGLLPLRLDPDELGVLPDDGTAVRREGRNPLSGDRWIEESFRLLDPADGTPLGAIVLHYGTGEAPAAGVEPYRAWVRSVGWSLLRPPVGDTTGFRTQVSEGISALLPELPIENLLVVDDRNRIQYTSDVEWIDQKIRGQRSRVLFGATAPQRKSIQLPDGTDGTEVMLPIYASEAAEGGERERLGSVLLHYRPDERLSMLIPALGQRSVGFQTYLEPLLILLVAAVGSGILIALATSIPVQRLERAFSSFRQRGFKGGFDPAGKLPSELKETVRAMQEMGGRLEQLDVRGGEREALLATLSQSLEDGMLAVDGEGAPLAWNPAALRLLVGGVPNDSDDEERRTESERKRLLAALARNPDLQFALERVALGETREVELVRHDGWSLAVRVTQVPVVLQPGRQGYLLLIRDVGALRRVEAHLLEAGRFAVLTHLAAGLAHEVRNPLHAIRVNADVVQEYARRGSLTFERDAVEQSVSAIRDEAKRLTDLLNNYLGLVRSGEEPGPVDLVEVVRKVNQLVRYSAQRSNVDLVVDAAHGLPMVPGDATRLQQAVLNLVLNAIQAMPDGGEVRIGVRAVSRAVRLSIEDTGPGLPEELADSLFDTRLTTKPQGSGLGLPMVRMLVEAHGGSVRYLPRAGGGATFEVLLPTEAPEIGAIDPRAGVGGHAAADAGDAAASAPGGVAVPRPPATP